MFYGLKAGIGYEGTVYGAELNGEVTKGDFEDKSIELILKVKK